MKRFDFFVKVAPFFLCAALFSETTTPVRPSMPSISTPTLGSNFYTPGSNGFYSGSRPGAPYVPQFIQNGQNANRVLTETQKKQIAEESADIIGRVEKVPEITAKDLSSLESLGLLGKISGLVGTGALQKSTDSNDGETLRNILQKLNEIKQSLDENAKKETVKSDFPNERSAQILRFLVDGTDFTPFLRSVYFSDEETDGTFLLTGDVRYAQDGVQKNETFYVLFSASGNNGGATAYTVSAESNRNFEGETALSRLSNQNALVASRTGNLVSLRVNNASLKLDLLLSMRAIGQ